MPKIFTLNARDTVLLDLLMQLDGLSFAELGPVTRSFHQRTVDLLRSKDVEYSELRSALVPQTTTKDVGLVFDSSAIESGFYGAEVARRVIPHLDRGWSGSILLGDLIHPNQEAAFHLLESGARLIQNVEVRDSSQLFCVYLSNLTANRREALLAGLSDYPAFIGYIPATYHSQLKDWLSATMVNRYVKRGSVFVGPHEDDLEEASDYNLGWWPLEEFGYRCVSVPEACFDLFLSYKIERAVHPAFESDTLHGLATISQDPQPLGEFVVVVDPDKLEYLQGAKAGTLARAGLAEVTPKDLELQIAAKINQNYVYELEYLADHKVSKFNVVIEVDGPSGDPVRLVVALKYLPKERELHLITIPR